MTCLHVLGIIGVYCFSAAGQIGNCIELETAVYFCRSEAEALPVFASLYDPALGGHNCMEPCALLGDGTPVSEAYGWAAACPLGWYDQIIEVTAWGDRWWCRDHGGNIAPVWLTSFQCSDGVCGEERGWAIIVDFLVNLNDEFSAPLPYAGALLDWRFVDDL